MDNSAQPPKVKYNPQFKQEVDKYIEECQKNKTTPTVKGFAERIGTDEQSIWAWAKKIRKDEQGNLTDKLARPQFLAQVKKLEQLSQPRQEKHPNLKKGNVGNHGQGRPTKYTPEMLKKAEKYLKECVDKVEDIIESENDKTGRVRYRPQLVVKLPKAAGLALYLGVSKSRLYEWADRYPEFQDILERINQIQEDRVLNEALAGNYNPLIAKLLLGKHGYRDESKQEHSGSVIWREEEPK